MREKRMGRSELLSTRAVADLLDVTPQTVNHLVEEGVLTPTYERVPGQPPKRRFRTEEVEDYEEARRSPRGRANAGLLARQATATARALERRVSFLEEVLGARLNPPAVDADSVISCLQEATDDLEVIPATVERILYWARFFVGVGEEFFDMLEAATSDEEAWTTFQDLAQAIVSEKNVEALELSHELQAAYNYLEVGRRNLRAVLFMFLCSRFGARKAVRAIGRVQDVHDEVLNSAVIGVVSKAPSR